MTREDLISRLDATVARPDAVGAEVHKLAADSMRLAVACVFAPPVWTTRLATMLRGSGVRLGSLVGYPHGTSKPTIKAIEATSTTKDGADRIEVVPHHALLLASDSDGARAELIEIARAARATRRDVHLATLLDVEMLLRRGGEGAIEIACRATRESGFDAITLAAEPATHEALALVKKYGESLAIKVTGVNDPTAARALLAAGVDRVGTDDPHAILGDGGA